ncbi:MAG TPA: DUF2207 domain-containing protein [Candidatus Saccharimonadales bacterium]|nr:DUF2207 domain-containing protein [Candidatus Saccharimonadales bacterium]
MKRLILLFVSLVLLSFFIVPHPVHAAEDWVIENFNSDIAVQSTGIVHVTETISVDFRDTPKHGIYRDIPYEYDSNGTQKYTEITIQKVLQNNEPANYTISQNDGYDEIKIGDSNRTITGRNIYIISYTAKGILQNVGTSDELYWNVTGNNWEVTIQKAEAEVSLPKNGMTRVICYQGDTGSTDTCQSNLNSSQSASFATTTFLSPEQGMTIAADWIHGLVPLLTATPPKPYWQRLFEPLSLTPLILVLVVGLGAIGVLWYRNGRDFWFAGTLFGTKDQKGKAKPIGAHETISVEFTPPEKLRPAEIGVLMDERADTRDVTSTIIDLATHGYLTITEVPKKWVFGKVDYLLTQTKPKASRKNVGLLGYEQLLLDKLFYKRRQVKLSSLKTTFYTDLKKVKQALYDDVVAKGLFQVSPEETRNKYIIGAVSMILFGGVVLLGGYKANVTLLGDSGIGLFFVGIVWLFMARFMPSKTAYGRECLRRSKGYYLFINSAEKYRQQYFEKENMFNEVLPYAIMFGLTKKFAKQMENMGIEPSSTGWYAGSQPFATGVFISNIDAFSNSLSTAMAQAPSSSGGFSGGSSGGGFGGGGGGSW